MQANLYLIVTNPFYHAKKRQLLNWLLHELAVRKLNYVFYETHVDLDENQHYFSEQLPHCSKVVVLGGDGTLHLTVNAMASFDLPLALLPCGTGNDFARGLGWSVAQFKQAVFSERVQSIDLGMINQRRFINIAGIGFDGAVVASQGRYLRTVWSQLHYLRLALKQLVVYKGAFIALQFLGKEHCYRNFMTVFANGQYFAGGMKIAPLAQVSSGHLHCVMIEELSMLKKALYLSKVYFGTHLRARAVNTCDAAAFKVDTSGLAIEADGEFVGYTPAIIEVIPNGLKLQAP